MGGGRGSEGPVSHIHIFPDLVSPWVIHSDPYFPVRKLEKNLQYLKKNVLLIQVIQEVYTGLPAYDGEREDSNLVGKRASLLSNFVRLINPNKWTVFILISKPACQKSKSFEYESGFDSDLNLMPLLAISGLLVQICT